ncbi:DUF4181 domain-containing protein [Paenibacillus lautus]|uniref:DUF4181 domain-containing protein n=1 Tax=Paenibacillus lautus TaxID=1401 RepID=UPI000BBDECB7|nr:DUF4181 domain-containing protein [Paenibacillus lautus]PCL93380.1 hypothetical protein CPZ30_08010 [Paenibacillus lautus]GIP03486.1 hypothetical protein J28TS4_18930 [Paenibacillus lautus]
MFLMTIMLYVIIFICGYVWIKKKLKVSSTSDGLLYKHINRFHLIGELVLVVAALIAIFVMRYVLEWRVWAHQDIILVVAILHAFRSVVERRYMKDTKQHFLSAYASVSGLLLFLGLELFA